MSGNLHAVPVQLGAHTGQATAPGWLTQSLIMPCALMSTRMPAAMHACMHVQSLQGSYLQVLHIAARGLQPKAQVLSDLLGGVLLAALHVSGHESTSSSHA